MPKVTLNKNAPLDEAARKVYGFFSSGISDERACKIMGYTRTTHYRRINHPDSFTLAELRTLYRETKLPDEVFMRMIREEPKS